MTSRLLLRPGLRVLDRGRGLLQVGLDPARAVHLPGTPAVRRTLEALTPGGRTGPCDPEVVARLEHAGLLQVVPDPAPASPRVVVRTAGAPLPRSVTVALADVGLPIEPTGGRAPLAGTALLVSHGEPRREVLDDWVAAGVAHLVLRFTEGAALVGPYVVPGATACLRCVDAHHTDADPRWPLLVEQQTRPAAVPDPIDPLLARLAAAWVARDLATAHAGGSDVPATWSTTLRLPASLAGFEAIGWLRHPTCGCSLSLTPGVPLSAEPPAGADGSPSAAR